MVAAVHFSAPGYWPAQKNATFEANKETVVDLELIPICDGATIRGRVVDATNQQPLEDASVFVSGNGSDLTDANGRYEITDVQVGNNNSPTQVTVSSGQYNVRDFVYQYLWGAGLTKLAKTDVTTTFEFLAPTSGGSTPTEPYQGEKGQPFAVSVRIPWDKVRWINIGIINPTEVKFRVTWQMLIDDKFTVDDSLPTW